MQLPLTDVPTAGVSGGIGAALEQLMSAQCLPQRWVRRVYRAAELPVRLQGLLCAVGIDPVWRAFTDGTQWWFGLAFERRTPGGPALEFDAYFFCQDARLWAGGRWALTGNAGLALREIYDPTALERANAAQPRALRVIPGGRPALPAPDTPLDARQPPEAA